MNLTADQRQWLSRVQSEWREIMKPSAQALGEHLFGAPRWLPETAVANARLFSSRSLAWHNLPKGGTIAELGTQKGQYARQILDVCQPTELHLYDLEFDTLRSYRSDVAQDPRVHLHLGDSSSLLAEMPDQSFDWIYIDGDHSQAGVQRDADCASRKIKQDGILVFNDYTVWSPMELTDYGIVPVVNAMLAQGEWEAVYLALHPMMYCDIALRRRATG